MKDLKALIPATDGDVKIPLQDLVTANLLVSQKQGAKSETWKIMRFSKPKQIYKENYVRGRNVSETYIQSGTARFPVGTTDFPPHAIFMNLNKLGGKKPDGTDRVIGSLHLVGEEILKWFNENKIAVKTDEYGVPVVDNYNHREAAMEERRARRTMMMPAAMAGRK